MSKKLCVKCSSSEISSEGIYCKALDRWVGRCSEQQCVLERAIKDMNIADLKKKEREQTPAQKIINQVNKGVLPPLPHPVGKSKSLGFGLQEFTP